MPNRWRMGRGTLGTLGPSWSKFFHFHAVFGKDLSNNRLMSVYCRVGAASLGNSGSATAK